MAGRKLFAENYQRILLIKFHHVFMSLIILHQVFSSLIKLQQVFNFLIKFHLNHKNLIISAPGLARTVLNVFLHYEFGTQKVEPVMREFDISS